MIRVCYIVDAHYVGGAEQYVRRIALSLDRSAFTPSLVVRDDSDEIGAWSDEMARSGVSSIRVPMSLPFRPLHARGLVRAIGATSPHIVHVNMPGPYDGQMGLVCPLARIAGARAVVTTEHLPMVERLWKRAAVKRFAYRFVDRVLTVCEANVPFLVNRQGAEARRIVVIPNGVDEAFGTTSVDPVDVRMRLGLDAETPVVTFVGNIEARKGLDRVIRALAGVGSLPWQLLVVGDGPERARCESIAGELGVRDRVTFSGRLGPDEVEAALQVSEVLALPSAIEGMPYVILEAMAAGTAVVATRVAGIPEQVTHGETGLLIDAGDDAALRSSLAQLLGDENARSAMGRAARRRFEAFFTLERQVTAISSLYRTLVGASAEG